MSLDEVNRHPADYGEKIVFCFRSCCERNGLGVGASPSEVLVEMAARGWLSALDTVIDIADLMRELRNMGKL